MSIKDIFLNGGGVLLVLLTVVQIAPIKVNPWSAIARLLGKAINADVLTELDDVKGQQRETRQALDTHIRIDDERNADSHRQRILQYITICCPIHKKLVEPNGERTVSSCFSPLHYR